MKHKSVYVGYGVLLAGLTVMRLVQLLFTIDSATGFYKLQYSYFYYVSLAALVFSAAVIIYFSAVDLKFGNQYPNGKIHKVLSVAVGILFIFLFINKTESYRQTSFGMLVLLSEAIAALGFILYGIIGLFGKKDFPAISLITVPAFVVELIVVFIKNNGVSTVPEMVYDVLMLSLSIVFSIQSAKHINGLMSQKEIKIMFVTGLFTSIMSIITVLPRFIIILMGNGEVLHKTAVSEPVYLAFGIFSLVYVIETFKKEKTKE